MAQGDFKKSYDAGKAAYREKRARWLVPSVVIVALTVEICRRHGVSWPQTLIARVRPDYAGGVDHYCRMVKRAIVPAR